MFGNEEGGQTAITFGFKDKTNGQAQSEYIEEVRGVVRQTNVAIVQERIQDITREDAHALIDDVERSGDPGRGIGPEDIISLPDKNFFRKRGPEDIVFRPYDVRGEMLTEDGKPLTAERYLAYLSGVLPTKFIGSREYDKYVDAMREGWHGSGDQVKG
jgi:hypothetical protein